MGWARIKWLFVGTLLAAEGRPTETPPPMEAPLETGRVATAPDSRCGSGPSCLQGICVWDNRMLKALCLCHEGWGGIRCDEPRCPRPCNYHGACEGNGTCACEDGWAGIMCELSVCNKGCSGKGTCTVEGNHTVCVCRAGHAGDDCAEAAPTCPMACSGQGECQEDGICVCDEGYKGDGCQKVGPQPLCRSSCSGKGMCDDQGECVCSKGFVGPTCEYVDDDDVPCLHLCSGLGYCRQNRTDAKNFRCQCGEGFEGKSCSLVSAAPVPSCPNRCSGHGSCSLSSCRCYKGYSGTDCSTVVDICYNGCMGHGTCINGKCRCYPGYYGQSCANVSGTCLNNCGGRGGCHGGAFWQAPTCVCNKGWFGKDCTRVVPVSHRACPNSCSGRGLCINNTCQCMPLHGGKGCSVAFQECLEQCSGHGRCSMGGCECEIPFTGRACSVVDVNLLTPRPLPSNSLHALRTRIAAFPRVAQPPAQEPVATKRSSSRLVESMSVVGAESLLVEGHGEGCGSRCGHHRECVDNVCVCEVGWDSDNDCKIPLGKDCLKGCCGHGFCTGTLILNRTVSLMGKSKQYLTATSICTCAVGWAGKDCCESAPDLKVLDSCPNHCSGHGSCALSVTRQEAIKSQLGIQGDRSHRPYSYSAPHPQLCACDSGFGDHDCSLVVQECANHCSAHGVCVEGKCHCEDQYSGVDCSVGDFTQQCPQSCNGHGACEMGRCVCLDGWHGADCLADPTATIPPPIAVQCPHHCSGQGMCDEVTGVCYCFDAWKGLDCSIPASSLLDFDEKSKRVK